MKKLILLIALWTNSEVFCQKNIGYFGTEIKQMSYFGFKVDVCLGVEITEQNNEVFADVYMTLLHVENPADNALTKYRGKKNGNLYHLEALTSKEEYRFAIPQFIEFEMKADEKYQPYLQGNLYDIYSGIKSPQPQFKLYKNAVKCPTTPKHNEVKIKLIENPIDKLIRLDNLVPHTKYEYKINDLQGNLVLLESIQSETTQYNISAKDLKTGIYILSVFDTEGKAILNEKIQKQ